MEGLRCLLELSPRFVKVSPALRNWLEAAPLGARLVALMGEVLSVTVSLAYEEQENEQDETGVLEEARNRREQLVELLKFVLAPHGSVAGVCARCIHTNWVNGIIMLF